MSYIFAIGAFSSSVNEYGFIRDQQNLSKLFPGVQSIIRKGICARRFNEMEGFSAFSFGRMPAEHDSKQAVHSIREVCREGNFRPSRDSSGLFHDERRIQSEEGLLWHGGARPTLNALIGHRKIERAKQGGQILAVHKSVEGATAAKRISDEID